MRGIWLPLLRIVLVLFAAATASPVGAQAPAPWPHQVRVPSGASVVIYQPQVTGWPDHKTLTARAAVAITRPNTTTPLLGTVDVSADTQTDFTTRMVTLTDMKLVGSHFPSLGTDEASALEVRIREALPSLGVKQVPLDNVLLSLKQAEQTGRPVALNDDPPVIFHSSRRASLVVFDGEPVLAPVGQTSLRFAVNTNWDVFSDETGEWYLLANGTWLAAPSYSGPYQPVKQLPPVFGQIPNDQNFADVRRALPAKPPTGPVPTIFVSTKPAEIIVTDGGPKFVPIAGTQLTYAGNTDADLFRYTPTGQFYFLVSGRWFSADSLDGPWSYATRQLPPDFAMIPANSPRARVLVSVPGTEKAQLAVLEAQIPHQATLKREGTTVTVTYAGTPDFRPIPGTDLTYAANTTYQVIAVSGQYFLCDQGAWFVAPAATGPWTLAASVPVAIYTIPPGNPLYNVTYVTVYGATTTEVTYGYTAGYMMGFLAGGVLAYGTGYYYPPVVIAGRVPVYMPYPYSYAGGVWYNASTGSWARAGAATGPYGRGYAGGTAYNANTGTWTHGSAVYGPYGGAGSWSSYNASTGTYAHGNAVWGPNGEAAHAGFYNPRTGVSGSTTQNANPYERWGSSTVSGTNRTINTASASNARGSVAGVQSSTGAAGAAYRGTNGNQATAVKGPGGDVYAGANGNVYQHSTSGWSKWNNGGWQPVQKPASPSAARPSFANQNEARQLEQDRQARTFAPQRGGAPQRANAADRFRR